MTFPRLDKDWLMAAPSLSLSPVAPVESARSLFNTKPNYYLLYQHLEQQLALFYDQWKVNVFSDI